MLDRRPASPDHQTEFTLHPSWTRSSDLLNGCEAARWLKFGLRSPEVLLRLPARARTVQDERHEGGNGKSGNDEHEVVRVQEMSHGPRAVQPRGRRRQRALWRP